MAATQNKFSTVRSVSIPGATFHYVSGITSGDDAPYDLAKQSQIVLDKIARLLEERGAKVSDIVKMTVFVSDMREFALFNEVRNAFFAEVEMPPASSAVEALLASPAKRIEIEAVAIVTK